jgi:lysophospholipase L1-like esterase
MKRFLFASSILALVIVALSCGGGGGGAATAASNPVAVIGDSLSVRMAGYLEADNLALSGATTGSLIGQVQDKNLSGYKTIYVMVGINDISMELDKDASLKNYSDLLDIIKVRSTARIVVQSVLPCALPALNVEIQTFNRNLQVLALQKGATYIDLWCVFLNVHTGEIMESADGFHLTEAGYRTWADYLKQAIA